MARDGRILDCFAGERVNRAFKRCAQECTLTTESDFSFEATVLKRTLVHFEAQWEEYDWKDRLLYPARSGQLSKVAGAADCFLASSMLVRGAIVARQDIVLLDGNPYDVVGCASVAGALALVTREFAFVRQETVTAGRWRHSSEMWELKWVHDHEMRYAVAWFTEGDDFVILSIEKP